MHAYIFFTCQKAYPDGLEDSLIKSMATVLLVLAQDVVDGIVFNGHLVVDDRQDSSPDNASSLAYGACMDNGLKDLSH